MTKNTLLAIAAFAAAIANTAKELAGDTAENTAPAPETGAPAEQPPTKRRGRPPTDPTSQPPADPAAPVAQGKTEAELREAIAPLVEDGRGEEVKKCLTKHGGTKVADLPAANHVAFLRDIEALKM